MSDDAANERCSEILFVDLEGSLLKSDLLWEGLFALIKNRPWYTLVIPFWALAGRSGLKARLAARISLDASELPYNSELVEIIRAERAVAARIVLTSTCAQDWAKDVSAHLGLFDDVVVTISDLKHEGRSTLRAIRAYCKIHDCDRFSYVGDSKSDLPIWTESETIYVVNPTAGLTRRMHALNRPIRQIGVDRRPFLEAARAMRPRQWVKNLLVFVPLVASMQIFDANRFALSFAAFGSFCCCASAIYIINDLVDLAADRAHPDKRSRPFASGNLALVWGPWMSAAMLFASGLISWIALPPRFLFVLVIYVVITLAYSFGLKSRLMVDVIVLANLYGMRLLAGNVATGIPISEWLLSFSLFFFLSLAFVKRYIELDRSNGPTRPEKIKGRGYRPSDLSVVENFGQCSGYIAMLILALYIKSAEVQEVYRRPDLLWAVCTVLIYWISRVWFLAKRGELSGDPVDFATSDTHSLVSTIVVAAIILCAAFLPGKDVRTTATSATSHVAPHPREIENSR